MTNNKSDDKITAVMTLAELEEERRKMQEARDNLRANLNAHEGVIQWLDMQIERLKQNNG